MYQLLRTELWFIDKEFGYNHEIWMYNFRVVLGKNYKLSEPRIHTLIQNTMDELGKNGDFSSGTLRKINEPVHGVQPNFVGDVSYEYSDYKVEWYVPGND